MDNSGAARTWSRLNSSHDADDNELLMGGAGNDHLIGGIGLDTILGASGDDLLLGGDDNDWIIADEGDDRVGGDAGDDWISGGIGDDLIFGRDGDDLLNGGNGNDTLSPGLGNNTIQGGNGNDVIYSDGETIIIGGGGVDRYVVSDFASSIAAPDLFRDFQVGFGGDVIDIRSAVSAVDPRFDTEYPWLQEPLHPFESGLIRLVASGNDTMLQVNLAFFSGSQGYATFATLQNVTPEQLSASNFNPPHDPFGRSSSIVGTDHADEIAGSLDDDILWGLGGDDTLTGSDGNDYIDGGTGNDSLHGGDGTDTIYGGDGDDHIQADPDFYGGDRYSPRPKPGGADYIDGGAGNDSFYEWRGTSNTIIGGAGDDVFYYVSSQADWVGYEYWPDEGIDHLTGGDGRDTYKIRYSEHSPADIVTDFETGSGGDVVDVSELLSWMPGYIPGTSPFQTKHLVLEQSGTSTLLKVPGEYYPDGLRTVLTLENTRVEDLTSENFVPPYDPSGTFGSVTGTAEADILDGTSYPEFLQALDGDDTARGHGGDDRLEGGEGNDRLEGGSGNDSLNGGAGDDRVSGGNGEDRLFGGDDNDRLQGDNGSDTLDGGAGDDLIMEVEGHHAFGSNDEMIWGGSGNDTIYGGAGNDYIDGGLNDDVIFGATGADTIFDIYGSNQIDGGLGNDEILMVSYNYPYGTEQPGIDLITGGAGQDRYSLSFDPTRVMVADHIMDFETGSGGDVVDLSNIVRFLRNHVEGSDPFETGLFRLTESGRDTLLEAQLQGSSGFSTILVMESTPSQLFSAENFTWL